MKETCTKTCREKHANSKPFRFQNAHFLLKMIKHQERLLIRLQIE